MSNVSLPKNSVILWQTPVLYSIKLTNMQYLGGRTFSILSRKIHSFNIFPKIHCSNKVKNRTLPNAN